MGVELKRVDQNSFATGKDQSLPSTKAPDSDPALVEKFKAALGEKPDPQDSDPALVDKFKTALSEKPKAHDTFQGSLGSYEKLSGQDQKASPSLQFDLSQDEAFKTDKNAQNPNDLSSILSSLMSGQSATTEQNPGEIKLQNQIPTSNLDDGQKLQDLANSIVDKILVSDPATTKGSEVRLILSGNTGDLSGSEIVLRRDLEGMLAVEINCRNQTQFKKYVELRSSLVEALEKHEDKEVRFILNEDFSDQDEHDTFNYHLNN